MGCDLIAGTPAAFAARVSLSAIDVAALAALTRLAADEQGATAPPPPAGGELASAWVDLFAGLGEAVTHRIAERWRREVGAEPEAADAAAEAIRAIADLCRTARTERLPVVCVSPG